MNSLDASQLPPVQRAAHYRELAQKLRSCAANAVTEDIRRAYLKLAVGWLDMADSLEIASEKVSVAVESEFASLLQEKVP